MNITVNGFPVIRWARTDPGQSVIIVDRGPDEFERFVVARHRDGDDEWCNGFYTNNADAAIKDFDRRSGGLPR